MRLFLATPQCRLPLNRDTHLLPTAQKLISSSDNNNIRAAHWADQQWNAEWADNPTKLRIFIPDTGSHSPEWPSQEEPGYGLTASALVSGVSAPACTNGVWPPLRLWVWRRRTNRRPCCPPVSNPSTSSWTARLDGSGWWDNRMAAQHLRRDLVCPSSG